MNIHKDKVHVKKELESMYLQISEFGVYLREGLAAMVVLAAAFLLCFGKQAFSINYYIDLEAVLNHPGTYYNWGDVGRFGLLGMKALLGLTWFNPYLEAVLTMLALFTAAAMFGYLLQKVAVHLPVSVLTIAGLLLFVHPVYAEQFLFRFQAFEVVLAILLLEIANLWLLLWLNFGNRLAALGSVLLMTISIGTYQALANVEIVFLLGLFLLHMHGTRRDEVGRKLWLIKVRLSALKMAAVYLASLACYLLISKLFFSRGEYLEQQIVWGQRSLQSILEELWVFAKAFWMGREVFFPKSGALLALGLGIVLLLLWRNRKKENAPIVQTLVILGLLAAPLLLGLLEGQRPVYRALLTMPATIAVGFVLVYHKLAQKRVHKAIVFLGIVCVFLQLAPLMRLQYTDDVVRRQDDMTAAQIVEKIRETQAEYGEMPVVFCGHLEAGLNDSCYQNPLEASYLCRSSFAYDYEVEPVNYHSTGRILGYLQTLGWTFEEPTPAQTEAASLLAADAERPCWPAKESIFVDEEEKVLVVKLSE